MLTNSDSEYKRYASIGVLTPPYEETAPITPFTHSGTELPLGAVVYAVGTSVMESLGGLTATLVRSPWTIPCIVLAAGERLERALLDQLDTLRDRLAILDAEALAASDIRRAVIVAVRERPLPGPTAMARYVSNRISSPDLQDLLLDPFCIALEEDSIGGGHSVATYSRRFRRYGPYTSSDWRALATLAWALGRTTRYPGASASIDSLRRLSPRTLRRYVERFLEMSWTDAANKLGWEWVLEQALRTGWYVS